MKVRYLKVRYTKVRYMKVRYVKVRYMKVSRLDTLTILLQEQSLLPLHLHTMFHSTQLTVSAYLEVVIRYCVPAIVFEYYISTMSLNAIYLLCP